jgi:hypothetical protein
VTVFLEKYLLPILVGLSLVNMMLDGHIMRSLAYLIQRLGALMNAEADGVVVEEPVEIYTVMRIEGNPYGDRFQDIVYS